MNVFNYRLCLLNFRFLGTAFSFWRLIRLTDEDLESEMSFVGTGCFLLRNIGFNRGANDHEVVSCVDGAAIGSCGLKWRICFESGLPLKASSCLGFFFGIHIFKAGATLLVLEMQEREEEAMLTSSACFLDRLFILLSRICLDFSCGLLSNFFR